MKKILISSYFPSLVKTFFCNFAPCKMGSNISNRENTRKKVTVIKERLNPTKTNKQNRQGNEIQNFKWTLSRFFLWWHWSSYVRLKDDLGWTIQIKAACSSLNSLTCFLGCCQLSFKCKILCCIVANTVKFETLIQRSREYFCPKLTDSIWCSGLLRNIA